MPSFRKYIAKVAKAPPSPVGDFVRDARSDLQDGLPDAISWPEVRDYLCLQNACAECIEAAHQCWQNYRAWSQRNA